MNSKISAKTTIESGKKLYLCNTVKHFPFKSTLSLEYLINFWKEEANHSNSYRSSHAKALLDELSNAPELVKPINDMDILKKYSDLVDQLMTAIYPASTWESQVSTSNPPFQFQSFYSSPMFNEIFGINKEGKFGNADFDEHEMLASKILSAYLMILDKFYNKKISIENQFIMGVNDDLLKRYFKIDVDPRFINIKAIGNPPLIDDEKIKYILNDVANLDRWREVLPPENFEFAGFVTISATNVTDQETLSQLKHDLLERASIISLDRFLELQQNLRNYLRLPDIKLGLVSFSGEWRMMLDYGNKVGLSFIMNENIKNSCESLRNSVYAKAFEEKSAVIIDDLTALKNKTAVEEGIIEQGIKNIILAPLYYQDELVGILELGSPNKGDLNSLVVRKLKEVLSLFSIAVNRNIEDFQNKIQALIKEECTAIHPTVEWRFKQAAFSLLHEKESDPGAAMEEIVFDNLYPLYGLSDIKDSSLHRNDAIRSDLIDQLNLVKDILSAANNLKQLPITDELNFRANKFIKSLSKGLSTGDEVSITNYLNNEVDSLLDHIKIYDPSLLDKIIKYREQLNDESKLYYKKRKDYEESITKINETIGSYLDKVQEEAQQMFPHYFEKYKTDGVEHSIYIGQSLVNGKEYNPIYLKNLRLWQLIVLCEVALRTERLRSSLNMDLETTHLVLIQNNPLSIRFRYDEKKFDVDGTYNLRYEIMKKRIDKAIIKGSKERLTMPGRIAVVYSQNAEAMEYKRYFEYLNSKKYISNDVEELDLEPLQGVQGLKALRIKVNFNSEIQSGTSIKSDVEKGIKHLPELLN
jgi:hypothetical protein